MGKNQFLNPTCFFLGWIEIQSFLLNNIINSAWWGEAPLWGVQAEESGKDLAMLSHKTVVANPFNTGTHFLKMIHQQDLPSFTRLKKKIPGHLFKGPVILFMVGEKAAFWSICWNPSSLDQDYSSVLAFPFVWPSTWAKPCWFTQMCSLVSFSTRLNTFVSVEGGTTFLGVWELKSKCMMWLRFTFHSAPCIFLLSLSLSDSWHTIRFDSVWQTW